MATPEKYVTLRRGDSFVVCTDLGDTRELRLCVVPGRLAIDLLMAAGNEDPQSVVALAAGLPVEDLDWIASEELPRLQEAVLDLNFETCAVIADSRAAAARRMLPILRKAAKPAIEQAVSDLIGSWEKSLNSKLPSLKSTIEQALSSASTPPSSSPANPSQESESACSKPPSGGSDRPSS